MFLLFNAKAVPAPVATNLQAYSWSFAHYFLWRGFGVLFDCGEGCAIRLDNHVFRAEVLAFSHAHSDHCRGLMGLLDARYGLRGANDKPLLVVYPADSRPMAQWIQTAEEYASRRQLDCVAFQAIKPGEPVPLDHGRALEAIEVEHAPGVPCYAYRIGHMRKRLRPEFAALPPAEIAALVRARPRAELEEERFECELVYSGDARRLDAAFARGAQVLIHEASFLSAEDADQEKGVHADVPSVLAFARDTGARNLVLFHSSRRYDLGALRGTLPGLIEHSGLGCPVVLVRGAFNLPTD